MEDEKKVLLIVEDEAGLRNILKDRFVREKFTVFEAVNGEEGLEVATKELPQVILLDILMPKLDGMIMLKNLRANGEYGKKVKVIILTNLEANDRVIQEVIRTQPTYYLIKSNVKLDDIVEKVKEVINNDKI